MKIGIIGTGNMAHFLGTKLRDTAYPISMIYARNAVEGKALAQSIHAIYTQDLEAFQRAMDGIFLCVSDAAIEEVANQLSPLPNQWLVHCSGSVPSVVLASRAVHYGVLWPIYSIVKHDLPTHRQVPLYISGASGSVINTLEKIAGELSNLVKVGSDDEKKKLHLLAVMSNNFMNHFIALGQQYAQQEEIDYDWIMPIVKQTVERIQSRSNAFRLQTGPAVRGDIDTIKKQQNLLSQHPDLLKIYNEMTQSIIHMHQSEK